MALTLAAAAALAGGVLTALLAAMGTANLLLVMGSVLLAACLHRLGRFGPERD